MKEIIVKGDSFNDLEGFYAEIDRVLTKDLDWKTGHNLSAFEDLLRGGFGVVEVDESYQLVWQNFDKSIRSLGQSQVAILVDIIEANELVELRIQK